MTIDQALAELEAVHRAALVAVEARCQAIRAAQSIEELRRIQRTPLSAVGRTPGHD